MAPSAPAGQGASVSRSDDLEQVARLRIITGANITTKGDPPLKELTRRFEDLAAAAEKQSSTEAAHHAFVRSNAYIMSQAKKLQAMRDANTREQRSHKQREDELIAGIAAAEADIQLKKLELNAARIVRRHKEEYEVLRKEVCSQPMRSATQQQIDAKHADIQALTEQSRHYDLVMQKRQSQVAALFKMTDRLQREWQDDVDVPAVGLAGGPVAMQLDSAS